MSEQSSGRGKLMGCLIALLVVVVVVFVVVPYGLRTYVRGKMTPQQIAMIERLKEPPQVPAEWAQVTPISPETKAAAAAFTQAWEKRASPNMPLAMSPGAMPGATTPDKRDTAQVSKVLAQMVKGPPLSDAERTFAADLVQKDRALVDAIVALGARPDYDTGVTDAPIGAMNSASFLAYQTGAKVALISARLDALDGETSRGLPTATSVLALARRHPASTLISQLIAIAVSHMASRTVADIAAQCDDPAALRNTLAEMERLAPQVTVPMPQDISVTDMLGNLRALKREGYPVDLDFTKPVTYLHDQNIDSMVRYPEWKMQQLAPNDPLRAQYSQMLANRTGQQGGLSIRQLLRYAGPYGDVLRDILVSIAVPNFEEASVRQKTAAAHFRLAELALAERLAHLEGAPAPAAAGDLVPKYLATQPQDPFGSGTFPRSTTDGFYSLGPDARDDQCAITYDPTNGTLSPGDIVLRAP